MSNLDPSKWRILNTIDLGKSMLFLAEPLEKPGACPHCRTLRPPKHAYGRRKVRLVDLPVSGKPVLVVAQRQRFRCLACNRIWLQPLSDVDEKHRLFKRAAEHIRKEALHRTHSSIARELGIDTKTVFNIVAEWIAQMDKNYRPSAPRALEIDEIRIHGQRRCVFSDLDSGRALDLLEKRTREGVQNWLSRLDDVRRIELVSMVPWSGYRAAIYQVVPQARVVVDKAHALALANRCLDHYRQAFKKTLSVNERRRLRKDQFLLLTSEKDLQSEDVRLRDSWLGQFPSLERAYRLKEYFSTVYEASNRREAQVWYAAWEASIPPDLRHAFKLLTTTMRIWQVEVFNYFDLQPRELHPFSESAGRLIADLVKSGRGYSFAILRAKVRYAYLQNTP